MDRQRAGAGALSEVTSSAARVSRRRRPRSGRRRGLLQNRSVIWAIRIATFAGAMLLWQLLGANVNRALFAPPSEVIPAIWRQLTQEPSIWAPLLLSLAAMAVGMGLGMVVGIPLGLAMGRSTALTFVLDPYVTFLYVLPGVALVPLFVVWFGFDFKFQVALVFESTLFPILINCAVGARHVDADLIDGGRSFCASDWQIMRTIVVPASLPFVFAGIRLGFSAAWVGVVVAQMTGALTGLGGLILTYAATFRTADMLVPILAIMLVGVIIHGLTARLLIRMTPWHSDRAATRE